jgi:hypothetical protein
MHIIRNIAFKLLSTPILEHSLSSVATPAASPVTTVDLNSWALVLPILMAM